jgi:hypothetical protein
MPGWRGISISIADQCDMLERQQESQEAERKYSSEPYRSLLWALGFLILTFATLAVAQLAWIYAHTSRLTADHALDDYLHFAIPLAVLIMELYMIRKMAKESVERARTISRFRDIAASSSRAEYLLDLAIAIRETKSYARFTSATMEVSTRSQGQKAILDAVRQRRARGEYEHRGLLARCERALPGAIELAMRTHVKIRFHDKISLSRLRFFVRDREESIVGVADGEPDLAASKATTQSTRIRSRMLAEALERQFEDLWQSATELSSYVDSLIKVAMPATKAEVRSWFSRIPCDRKQLDDTLTKNSTLYGDLPEDIDGLGGAEPAPSGPSHPGQRGDGAGTGTEVPA